MENPINHDSPEAKPQVYIDAVKLARAMKNRGFIKADGTPHRTALATVAGVSVRTIARKLDAEVPWTMQSDFDNIVDALLQGYGEQSADDKYTPSAKDRHDMGRAIAAFLPQDSLYREVPGSVSVNVLKDASIPLLKKVLDRVVNHITQSRTLLAARHNPPALRPGRSGGGGPHDDAEPQTSDGAQQDMLAAVDEAREIMNDADTSAAISSAAERVYAAVVAARQYYNDEESVRLGAEAAYQRELKTSGDLEGTGYTRSTLIQFAEDCNADAIYADTVGLPQEGERARGFATLYLAYGEIITELRSTIIKLEMSIRQDVNACNALHRTLENSHWVIRRDILNTFARATNSMAGAIGREGGMLLRGDWKKLTGDVKAAHDSDTTADMLIMMERAIRTTLKSHKK